jgi:hypothetical protein
LNRKAELESAMIEEWSVVSAVEVMLVGRRPEVWRKFVPELRGRNTK